jgi:hypothetical protein
VIQDEQGVNRFKANAIVVRLLAFASARGYGLNEIAMGRFSQDDRIQFAQLHGYSVGGFCELSEVDDDTKNAVDLMMAGAPEITARIESLSAELDALRAALREPMARLFGVHPDDLGGSHEA